MSSKANWETRLAFLLFTAYLDAPFEHCGTSAEQIVMRPMLIDGKIYVPIEGPGGKMSGAMEPFPEDDPSYPALLAALQSKKEAYAIYYSADGTPIRRVNFRLLVQPLQLINRSN